MYDLIIENARICDGTGKPSFYGNVAVKDGLIAAVGKGNGEAATKKINADGLALAPGFIDLKSLGTRWSPAHPGTASLLW
jgi:N-acyl-D-aspartate/D-glutamate deacylase